MTEKDETPDHRCGFELISDMEDYVEVVSHPFRGEAVQSFPKEALKPWHIQTRAVCCWRETWQDTGRCVWHAEIEDKPIEVLKAARADGPERLEGAFLAGVTASENDISFHGCGLRGADFSDSTFPSAHFQDADLEWADFRNAHLFSGNFHNSELLRTEFHDAYLAATEFHGASLLLAEFHGATLYNAEFHSASLRKVEFHGASLRKVEFHGAFLTDAQFHDADLTDAEFHGASLTGADYTDADTFAADFTQSTLHDALFTRADCRGAIFTNALLYETVFADTRINSQTTFHDPTTSRPIVVYEENPSTSEDLPEDVHRFEAAEWVYRRLEKLHDENALSEDARDFHISKEEVRRKYQCESEEYARCAVSTLQWHVTGHGESISRIFRSAAVLILVCGILYPFAGGFESSSTGATYRLHPFAVEFSRVALGDTIATLLQSIYFSVITFTTIGYGDLYPTGAWSKVLVAFESLSGAILIALFVFVLGRRVAR